MDLLFFRGLNCQLACIVSIANALGVQYQHAFATLWSETDFTYEANYHICVSKRVFRNLQAMGITMDMLDFDALRTKESMAHIPDGALFFVGMDIFYIPWHPVFNHFHDLHYFFAQKETADTVLCFDPVYDVQHRSVQASEILPFAFELGLVYRVDARPPEIELAQEAMAVLRSHPTTTENIFAEIQTCRGVGKKNAPSLIMKINAMLNNRYLFETFLHHPAYNASRFAAFFDEDYFAQWEAFRNGLYKVSIMKDNNNMIEEVSALFICLMDEEIRMAEEIIAMDARHGGETVFIHSP